MNSADALKVKGNDAFREKRYPEAIECYTKAIAADSGNHVLYSNRCACFVALSEYDTALADAEKCVALKPDWGKGYCRVGEVYLARERLGDLEKAQAAYEQGLLLEPTLGALLTGIEAVKKALVEAEKNASWIPLKPIRYLRTAPAALEPGEIAMMEEGYGGRIMLFPAPDRRARPKDPDFFLPMCFAGEHGIEPSEVFWRRHPADSIGTDPLEVLRAEVLRNKAERSSLEGLRALREAGEAAILKRA